MKNYEFFSIKNSIYIDRLKLKDIRKEKFIWKDNNYWEILKNLTICAEGLFKHVAHPCFYQQSSA